MTINHKMIRNIIISVVVLALLVGVYLWVQKWQNDDASENVSTDDVIEIFSTDSKNITEIDVKNSFSEYTLIRSGEDDDIKWSIPEYSGLEFSQAKLQLAASAFMGIYAIKEIGENVENLSDFGLADENVTTTIHTADGEQCTLILGDKLAVDSTYYLMKKGSSTVYTVSEYTASAMMKVPNDYRETNSGGIDAATVEEFSVSKNGVKVMEIKRFSENESVSEIDLIDLKMTYPYEEKIRSDLFETMIAPFATTVEVIDFVSDDLSKASEYGLDKGYKVVLKDAQKIHTLTFGDVAEDGNVYTIYNDNNYIFTMNPGMLNAVKDIKPFDLIQKFAHIYNIKDVKSVVVSSKDKTYTFEITGGEDDTKYSINGKSANEEMSKDIYQKIIGLSFTGVVSDRSKATDVVCEVMFNMNDGTTKSAVYRSYDERNLMVTRPDGKENIILKKYVEDMLNEVENFAENPTKEK